MNKIVADLVLALFLILLIWKVMGKGLANWVSGARTIEREPDVDATDATKLKALKATLVEKQAKLKNKNEIAQVQKQLDEVDLKLGRLS